MNLSLSLVKQKKEVRLDLRALPLTSLLSDPKEIMNVKLSYTKKY